MSEGWLVPHQAKLAVGARGLKRGITRAMHAARARTELATLRMEPLLALSRPLPVLSAFIAALLAASTFGLSHCGIVCATVLAAGALAFNF